MSHRFDAEGVAALAVDSGTGSVAVWGHGGDAIRVQADERVASEDGLEAVSVDGRREDDRLVVETERDLGSGILDWRPKLSLHLVVAVPEGVAVERAATEAGWIDVDGVAGPIAAIADVGDVYVAAVDGAVDARTRRGDVTVRDATGPISARTRAGDVTVDGVIETLRTDAGEIRATVRGLGEGPAIRGAAADVALAIARELDVTVETDVDLGDVDVHGEGLETAVAEAAGSVRVVGGEGSDRLVIDTRAGNVSVTTV